MQVAARILSQAGYARYEVASYAKPGFECRHNIAYWTGVPYLGLGRSAASMTQNAERRMRVQDGQVTDDLDARELVAEDMMLGMRMSRGISDRAGAGGPLNCSRKPGRRWRSWPRRDCASTLTAGGDLPSAGGCAVISFTEPCSI